MQEMQICWESESLFIFLILINLDVWEIFLLITGIRTRCIYEKEYVTN